jgi:acyl-coenzyme A thioesterase PaaI-like protein
MSQARRARRFGHELDANERHANPMGTLHGGVICDV